MLEISKKFLEINQKSEKMKKIKADENMVTDKFLAKEFDVQPKLIRCTIEKIIHYYNIDPALVKKGETKRGTPEWLIHKSLRKDLATELLPNFTSVRSFKSSIGSKKPGLDVYDGNFQ